MPDRNLLWDYEEPWEREYVDRNCTPEKLLAFILEHRKMHRKNPSLLDIKKKFGGILGPMVDFWQLKRERRV